MTLELTQQHYLITEKNILKGHTFSNHLTLGMIFFGLIHNLGLFLNQNNPSQWPRIEFEMLTSLNYYKS